MILTKHPLRIAALMVCGLFSPLLAFSAAPETDIGADISSDAKTSTGNQDWELTRKGEFRSEVSTWVREIPGQQLNAFRGRVTLPYTLLEVLAALADIENYPKWVFKCHDTEHLREIGDDIVYVHIKIWPVTDRDVVTRSKVLQDPNTLTVTIHTWADNDLLPEKKKIVRMPELENLFILEPQRDGWTRVTFQTFADPGGAIPGWVANVVATQAPLDTLRGLKKRLKKKQYHVTRLEQLPFTLPGMDTMTFPTRRPR